MLMVFSTYSDIYGMVKTEWHTFLAEVKQGSALPSYLKCNFCAFFFSFLFLVISLFKMSPKHCAEGLSSSPKHTRL